jgi:AraC-like DNA-binding protein
VGDLAARLGYANTTHFIRQFKKQTGVSPLRYRKNHLPKSRQQ